MHCRIGQRRWNDFEKDIRIRTLIIRRTEWFIRISLLICLLPAAPYSLYLIAILSNKYAIRRIEKKTGYVYGLSFAGYDIRFTVEDGILKVFEVISTQQQDLGNIPHIK